MGTWTQIEDTHVFFFEEEPLVALPTEDNAKAWPGGRAILW